MICALDYETTGLDFYSPTFEITSAAFLYQGGPKGGETEFLVDAFDIYRVLAETIEAGYKILVHNLQFEYGCTLYRFPDLVDKIDWVDSMRLVQLYDNGGKQGYKNVSDMSLNDEIALLEGKGQVYTSGLGLEAASSRLLPVSLQSHKKEAHTWLAENHGIKKNPGEHLQMLPIEILKRYNIADVQITLALYNFCINEFRVSGFDWTKDHGLYSHIAKRISRGKGQGIKVDRDLLAVSIQGLKDEISNIEQSFRQAHLEDILAIEKQRQAAWLNSPKSDRGKEQRRKRLKENPEIFEKEVRFNPGSSKQLELLFVEKLGITPRFFTDKGSPSFKSSHMSHYGAGGKILAKKKKRQLVLGQAENLYKLSEADGYWHQDLRSCGTATGRMAGGRHK